MPPPTPHVCSLRSGRLRLSARADLGGCLAGLWHADTPVLRSTEAALLTSPRQSACFPLLPYSNRLSHRQLSWNGQQHTLRPNFEGSPHTLHGVGWLRAWAVLEHAGDKLRLGYDHTPDDDWPFAFRAEQHIHLTPESLHMTLDLHNTAHQTQPVGLGWHPYFPKRDAAHLLLTAAHRWENDSLHLPSHTSSCNGLNAAVDTLSLDHCFDGWDGTAQIADGTFSLRLRSNLSRVVVFTPAGQTFFCVEPVSHVNNALQMANPMAHGMAALAPGQHLRAQFTLGVTPL